MRLLTVISLLSFLFLLLWELTEEHPIIELTLFKNRNFSLGVIIISISYMLFFGTLVVTPLWLQDYMGYTSLVAGLAVSTMGIPPFCTVLLVGMLMQRCRLRNLVIVSFLFFATAFFYFTRFDTDVSSEKIALSRLLLGCGLVTYIAPLMGITFAHFPNEKLASGQGIFHFLRILFGGIGASLFITFWDRRATHHHSNLVDSINHFDSASNKLFSSLAQYQIKGQPVLELVDNLAWKQAYMLSLNDLFWVSGWAFIILLFSCFLFKKRKAPLSFEVASH
ncbi:MAG: MFS transporter [Simkania negevensis]|nr:MFS transporter [Simkania negevensis]